MMMLTMHWELPKFSHSLKNAPPILNVKKLKGKQES